MSFTRGNEAEGPPRRFPMAHADPVYDRDYAEHLASYRSFLRGLRYSIAAIAVVLILLTYFLM